MSLASRLFRPTFSNSRSASSAFVNVIVRSPEPFSLLIPEDCGEFST